MSSIIDEMCKILGMKKLWTTPYHPQTNWLVERSHQTITRMSRKLGQEKRLTGQDIWLRCDMPTMLPYPPQPGIVHIIKCLDEGLGSQLTFTSPSIGVQRPSWEAPLPNMWTNTWLLSMTNLEPSIQRVRPSQWQKLNDRNHTPTEK